MTMFSCANCGNEVGEHDDECANCDHDLTVSDDDDDYEELSAPDYLRDLAQRLRHIAPIHGTDGGDVDRLQEIAREIESAKCSS
jgi:hypothetical protein